MIHAAIMGSIERFLAVLLEHLAGAFPLWLAPVQIVVLPVSEKHAEYAAGLVQELKTADIRAELDADDSLGKRIRATKLSKVPYFIVVGDNEVAAETTTLENRSGDKQEIKLSDLIAKLTEEIRTRS